MRARTCQCRLCVGVRACGSPGESPGVLHAVGAAVLRRRRQFSVPQARQYRSHVKTCPITVIGGGLAGSEAAWQLAERGHDVVVREMRPVRGTPAHKTDRLAELVCSNTFKSTETSNAHGLLKAEMRMLGSIVLQAADEARVPGGSALTVDRDVFSRGVHERVASHPRITLNREEVTAIPSPSIIATGPLTSDALASAIRSRLGVESLAFYDAIAPILSHDSIDHARVFRASRYGKETMPDEVEGAYLNCPLS